MSKDPITREQRKRETRAHIQAVAKRLMAERGYEQTTMRDLAREAGVGVGTIALHFKDKKSLLLATFHEDIGRAADAAFSAVEAGAPLRASMAAIVQTLYGFYANDSGYLRHVVRETLFVRGEWRERFDAQLDASLGQVVALLEAAQQRGEVRPDVDCGRTAMVLWSLYLTGLITGFQAERFDAVVMADEVMALCDVVLTGISDVAC